jgi:UDP-glucose 4-epimerase
MSIGESDMHNHRVFVTGAAGFIGSHLSERLVAQGCQVTGFDNFDAYYSDKERNLQGLLANPNFRLVKGDVLDFGLLKESMLGAEVVFHLAAQPGVRFSSENPWKTTSVNISGTLNVLLSAQQQDVRKVVFASSSSVYGISNRLPCSENSKTQPLSIYGASKLAAEEYCRTFSRLHGLPITILRYHTVYGPRLRPDLAIMKFMKALFNGEPILIYGDGSQTRDFTYVSDTVAATVLASEKGDNETFNVGRGESTTLNELIRILAGLTGSSPKFVKYEPARSDDMRDTQAGINKARRVLGYNPKVSLAEGLRKTVAWYRKEFRKTT